MDDRKIEVLIAAVETGSFNKAAQRCHCTQSAVTQIVNAVEAELGCKLVKRSHAGVRPTEEGEALMPLAMGAYEALSQLKLAAEGLASRDMRLRIGSYASIASSWLPEAVKSFKAAEPEVHVEIRIGSRDLGSLLQSGEVDVALCDDWLFEAEFSKEGEWDYRDPSQSDGRRKVAWVHLVDDPLFAVVPKSLRYKTGQTIARTELFSSPFVFNSDYLFSHYLTSRVTSLVKVNGDDSATMLSMVDAEMGVTVLPSLALANVPEGVCLLDIDPPGKQMLGAALPSDARKIARSFVRHLERRFGKR